MTLESRNIMPVGEDMHARYNNRVRNPSIVFYGGDDLARTCGDVICGPR